MEGDTCVFITELGRWEIWGGGGGGGGGARPEGPKGGVGCRISDRPKVEYLTYGEKRRPYSSMSDCYDRIEVNILLHCVLMLKSLPHNNELKSRVSRICGARLLWRAAGHSLLPGQTYLLVRHLNPRLTTANMPLRQSNSPAIYRTSFPCITNSAVSGFTLCTARPRFKSIRVVLGPSKKATTTWRALCFSLGEILFQKPTCCRQN